MEFFNKKEEVIDLKLTQFGRYLLSKGKFKPAFYSFFDDNVLYNPDNASVIEKQNESEKRIRETPTMHHQVSYSSLEKQFNNNYNKVLSGDLSPIDADYQRTAEKEYALPQPIGTSNINSEYSPSWTVKFLKGQISGSTGHIEVDEKAGSSRIILTPQITSKMEIELIDVGQAENADQLLEESEDGYLESNFVVATDEEDMFILLKVSENNGYFQRKNFDIEIFEIEEEKKGEKVIETLRPLNFSHKHDSSNNVSFIDDVFPDEDVTNVEYYFDVLVDEEINDDVLCDLDPVNIKMGHFSDDRTKLCQDIINKRKKKVFDIYTDESDLPGDVC